jgi:hypothetical protein
MAQKGVLPTPVVRTVEVEKPVDRVVEKLVEKIVYVDKPVENIVYIDRPNHEKRYELVTHLAAILGGLVRTSQAHRREAATMNVQSQQMHSAAAVLSIRARNLKAHADDTSREITRTQTLLHTQLALIQKARAANAEL